MPTEKAEGAVGTNDAVDLEAAPPAKSEPVHSPSVAQRADGADADEDDEHPCLYCFEPTTAETRIVASPCLCAGELAAQHTACLRHDLEYKMRLNCTLCKFPLQFSHRVEHHSVPRRMLTVLRRPLHMATGAITCVTVGTCIGVHFYLSTSWTLWFMLAASAAFTFNIYFFLDRYSKEAVMTLVFTLQEPSEEAKHKWLQEGPDGHSEERQLVPDDSGARAILTMRYDVADDPRSSADQVPPALRDVERQLRLVSASRRTGGRRPVHHRL